ncbi:hypothetical protein B9479_005482 [Cryptococcus floricola]|uniref:Uncharacterized protein n=1 Tax=Cryptococcus floricola TaxID=2591691 RepID=A0A5D3AUM0_9TREE|nr:hypothetical protein B9479_005482 [Cryptococcus floricola]
MPPISQPSKPSVRIAIGSPPLSPQADSSINALATATRDLAEFSRGEMVLYIQDLHIRNLLGSDRLSLEKSAGSLVAVAKALMEESACGESGGDKVKV